MRIVLLDADVIIDRRGLWDFMIDRKKQEESYIFCVADLGCNVGLPGKHL